MGFMNRLKQAKELRAAVRAKADFEARALTMDPDQLNSLGDDDLLTALVDRAFAAADKLTDPMALDQLGPVRSVIYTLTVFDREVQNGGLCQFFVNSSRDLAPRVSRDLQTIGAISYQQIYDDFIKRHHIDVEDLTSFIIEDLSEYERQIGRYPFDDFDDAYYRASLSEPLDMILLRFARANLDQV